MHDVLKGKATRFSHRREHAGRWAGDQALAIHVTRDTVVETHCESVVRQRPHLDDTRRARRQRKGSIFFGICRCSHSVQSSFNSSRCWAARSRTRA
jgi:hypothetical protein